MADLKTKITITADGKQAVDETERVRDGLGAIGDEAKANASSIDSFVDSFAPLGKVALGVNEVFELLGRFSGVAVDLAATADAYNGIAGRLKLVAGEGAALAQALEAVRQTANASGADLDATATLYTRLAQSTRELGFNQADVVALTDSINKSFAVSGASASEAQGAIRQLAQGLAAGALRGDEFNSVMEQSPRLSQALADGLGVPIGALRKLAEEGKLTAEVVTRALQSQAAAIEADFAKMPETIGRAVQKLSNEWTVFLGRLDATSGASATVAGAIGGLAGNLDAIADAAVYAGEVVLAAFSVKAAGALRAYAAEVVATASASAAATREALAAEALKAKVNQTVAATELERARSTQAATAATLADLQATLAAAKAGAIHGPQRAALEREVTAARQANAAATANMVKAEASFASAASASTAATTALTQQTTLLGAAKARVAGILAGLGPTLATLGYVLIAVEVYKLATNLMALREEYQKQKEIAADTAEIQGKVAEKLAEVSRVTGQTVTSMRDLDQAVEEGRIHFDQASGTWKAGAAELDKVAGAAGRTKAELTAMAEAAADAAKKHQENLANFGLQDLHAKLIQQFRDLADDPQANGSQIMSGLLITLDQIPRERAPEVMLALRRAFDRKAIGLDEFEAGLHAAEMAMQGVAQKADEASKRQAEANAKAAADAAKWREVLERKPDISLPEGQVEQVVSDIELARRAVGNSINQFHQELKDMAGAAGTYINDMRAQFTGLSSAAGAYFDQVALHTSGFQGAEIGRFYEDMAKHLAMVQNAFIDQTYTLEDLKDRLDSATASAADMTAAEQFLADQASGLVDIHHLLGEEQLEPLRDALEDARWRMQALRDEAADTLSSISDEWDRLNNNLDAIEARRGAAREADLKARLEAARATGDQQAIADLEKSLKLLKEITQARIEDAKERERQTATRTRGGDDSPTTTRPTTRPDTTGGVAPGRNPGNVTINLGGVLDLTDKVTLDSLGRKLAPVLRNLDRLNA